MSRVPIIITIILILVAGEVHAADPSQRTQIVVGSELDYPPYALVTEGGQADGFSVDLMKAVCDVMGIDVIFRVGPWSEVRAALENGEIDALPLVSYSDAREKVFDFTIPHTMGNGVFFKRKGSPSIQSTGELGGKEIVVMRSDATHDWLLRNGISENLVLIRTVSEALRALAAGKHDYALAPRLVGLLIVNKLGLTNLEVTGPLIDVHGRGYGFAVKEGNSALLAQFNEGLNIIKATGRYDEIYIKWFGIVDPRGIATAVIVRYVIWGAGGIAVLIGLTLTWIVFLRRAVNLKTIEIRLSRDDLDLRVQERTQDLQKEITERKQADHELLSANQFLDNQSRELEEMAQHLIRARDQAEIASRSKSKFLANMSHELRTPLNAIIGFSDVIKGEMFGPVGNPKYLEYVQDINESGLHLLELINDILDLSKIEAGKTELHEENVDVSRALGSCLTLVQERVEEAGVEIECDTASHLPALYADERKFKQILINLLSNAIKFTPTGGKVTIRTWSRKDDGYVLQIADTGIGIALADIPKALAPFSQIDSNLSRKYEGTGLGLPLTKALAELHGGSLDLQSEVDVGTTVTVRFPAERIVSETASVSTAQ